LNEQLECKGNCAGCGAPHGELCTIVRDLKEWKISHENRHTTELNQARELKITAFVVPAINIVTTLLTAYLAYRLLGVHP
jgi:hypothetical protein